MFFFTYFSKVCLIRVYKYEREYEWSAGCERSNNLVFALIVAFFVAAGTRVAVEVLRI